MSTPNTQLRVTSDAVDALKLVTTRFPRWSIAQLADTLIVESCRAILTAEEASFPTVDYIRQQMTLSRLESAAAEVSHSRAKPAAAKKAKRAA